MWMGAFVTKGRNCAAAAEHAGAERDRVEGVMTPTPELNDCGIRLAVHGFMPEIAGEDLENGSVEAIVAERRCLSPVCFWNRQSVVFGIRVDTVSALLFRPIVIIRSGEEEIVDTFADSMVSAAILRL